MTSWCYEMCHPTVLAAQSRYRQRLLLRDLVISVLAEPGCVSACCPPYGTEQMKCVFSGLQVLNALY